MTTGSERRLIELSHTITNGMVTYKGLPPFSICDYFSRSDLAQQYSDGSPFQIDRLDFVGNTGTYLDSPFHLLADGPDISGLALDSLAFLEGVVVRKPYRSGIAVDVSDFPNMDYRGKAVLIHTGWDEHWQTPEYFHGHAFLTERAAAMLVRFGARLVGIDSHNIDDTRTSRRPVHRALLSSGIPICEHLTNLGALPESGFSFFATPPRIAECGTFPVRAFAEVRRPIP